MAIIWNVIHFGSRLPPLALSLPLPQPSSFSKLSLGAYLVYLALKLELVVRRGHVPVAANYASSVRDASGTGLAGLMNH